MITAPEITNPPKVFSLISLLKGCFHLFRPYFGLRRNKLKRLFAAGVILACTVLSAFAMSFVNSSIISLTETLAVPLITYMAYFQAVGLVFFALAAYCTINIFKGWISRWLGESLSFALNKKMISDWINTKTYYNDTLRSKTEQKADQNADQNTEQKTEADPAQTFSQIISQLSNTIFELADNFLELLGNFAVGFIGLYNYSVPLTMTLLSTTITIPGFMLLSTLVYAVGHNLLTEKVGQSLKTDLDKQRKEESEFQKSIHHIESHAEAIAFNRGEPYELGSLLSIVRNTRLTQQVISKTRTALAFFSSFSGNFSSIIAYIIASPSFIAGKLDIYRLQELSINFMFVVNLFTWKSNNFDSLTLCQDSLDKINNMRNRIRIYANKIKMPTESNSDSIKPNPDLIEIRNLTVNKADGSPIIRQFNAHFIKNKRNYIEGNSGAGKTTLIRAMAGLQPIESGEIINLPEDTIFIPSEPYFPQNKTLIDAILYPNNGPATPKQVLKIKELMLAMGFKSDKIALLYQVKDWNDPHNLSKGQKMRIMIIRALLKEPSCIVMDEATNGNDKKIKEKILELLLKIPTTIFTDHETNDSCYDHEITISPTAVKP